jgi:superoxide dismutase
MFAVLLGVAMETHAHTENSDKVGIGSLPPGWETGVTGEGTDNQWAADHTTTTGDGMVILALHMYEHAYHMDYGVKAAGSVDAYISNINWRDVAQRYERATPRG